jgi:hypothetical protein
MVNWLVGNRDGDTACTFIDDLASRLTHRVQLSTDGHKPYLEAVEGAFGADIDYAMVIKMYSNAPTGTETRYSPAQCCGIAKARITGNPDMNHASTSYAERMNLQIRMGMRRFTRLTNAHSKKIENHRHALAIYFMYYNFARIHLTLRVTPAMEAGVTNRVWSIEEIVNLLAG